MLCSNEINENNSVFGKLLETIGKICQYKYIQNNKKQNFYEIE